MEEGGHLQRPNVGQKQKLHPTSVDDLEKSGDKTLAANIVADSTGCFKSRRSTILQHDSARVTQCATQHSLQPHEAEYPRNNTILEEAIAVSTMLLFFG